MQTLPEIDDFHYDQPLSSIDISQDIVYNKLTNLKPDKSPGPDGIHPRVLKEAASQLCFPFTLLFQRSFDEGVVPESWKAAKVIPIFKKETDLIQETMSDKSNICSM